MSATNDPNPNPNPSQPASAVDAASLLADAQAFVAKLTAFVGAPPALTQTDVRRSAKLRKGGEGVIPTLAALSDQSGLVVPSSPTSSMVQKLNQAQALIPLHKLMLVTAKQIGDVIFLAESQSWAAASLHYAMLRRLAKKDGSLTKALAPVAQFFAARSTAAKEAAKAKRGGARKGTKKPTAPTSPAAGAEAAATSSDHATATSGAPATPSNGASPSPATPSNGTAAR
jgi:hypothetical protein